MVGELQTVTVASHQLSGTLFHRETERLIGAQRLQGTQLVHTGDGQGPFVLIRSIQVGEEARVCQEIPAPTGCFQPSSSAGLQDVCCKALRPGSGRLKLELSP